MLRHRESADYVFRKGGREHQNTSEEALLSAQAPVSFEGDQCGTEINVGNDRIARFNVGEIAKRC